MKIIRRVINVVNPTGVGCGESKVKEKFINGKYQVDMASKGDRDDSGVFRQSTWH